MALLGYWKTCIEAVSSSDEESVDEVRSYASKYKSKIFSKKCKCKKQLSFSNIKQTGEIKSKQRLSLSEIKKTWYDFTDDDSSDFSDDSAYPASLLTSARSSVSSLSSYTSGYHDDSSINSLYMQLCDSRSQSSDSSDGESPCPPKLIGIKSQDNQNNKFNQDNLISSTIHGNNLHAGNRKLESEQGETGQSYVIKESRGFGFNKWYRPSTSRTSKSEQPAKIHDVRDDAAGILSEDISLTIDNRVSEVVQKSDRVSMVAQGSKGFGFNRWYQPQLLMENVKNYHVQD